MSFELNIQVNYPSLWTTIIIIELLSSDSSWIMWMCLLLKVVFPAYSSFSVTVVSKVHKLFERLLEPECESCFRSLLRHRDFSLTFPWTSTSGNSVSFQAIFDVNSFIGVIVKYVRFSIPLILVCISFITHPRALCHKMNSTKSQTTYSGN